MSGLAAGAYLVDMRVFNSEDAEDSASFDSFLIILGQGPDVLNFTQNGVDLCRGSHIAPFPEGEGTNCPGRLVDFLIDLGPPQLPDIPIGTFWFGCFSTNHFVLVPDISSSGCLGVLRASGDVPGFIFHEKDRFEVSLTPVFDSN